MTTSITYLPYSDTGYFSNLVIDYLQASPGLKEFYTYAPDAQGLRQAIEDRENYPVDRPLLIQILNAQYKNLIKHEKVTHSLALLSLDNTYTVCTAHQPNLLTGYLYFIYKIIHAIKLSEELSKLYPEKNFVPVYYMGSEDNDLEELGTFRYGGNKYVWDGDGQTGAVGRMKTEGLKGLLNELFKLFGPPGESCEDLKNIIANAYLHHNTISEATQCLVNELFGRYGLIVLNPDDAGLKRSFVSAMQDDLLHQAAYSIVSKEIEKLSTLYKTQASPRPINLFYLKDQLRERIEKRIDKWYVVNTDIQWSEAELREELHAHPDRFSPNVILRGLFQETILPDVAFIGGGAEVAYWLQLKSLFTHYNVFYPNLQLRQSALWVEPVPSNLRSRLQLSIPDIFKPEVDLIHFYIKNNSSDDWQTQEETKAMEMILNKLKEKAFLLDPTLKASAEAALAKIKHQLTTLEKKMLRAEKKKMQTQILKINKLKNALFPNNNLQERVENFTDYFLKYGFTYLDIVKDAMLPLKSQFLIIEMKDEVNTGIVFD